ncbi:hypothetical protein [Micromonospora sp. CPCC 206061]|uniref:hypothetical protein n=1 Tax=Micromonospora sp. CPCC 206061 TaxID=3122410 RepID=UPI002FF25BB7
MDVVHAPARRPSFVEGRLPALLLGLLFAVLGLYVVVAAGAYGRTWDEGLQNWYGEAVLNWYLSGGRDVGFIRDSNPREYMPQHGPFAEVLIAAVQRLTGEKWHTRSGWSSAHRRSWWLSRWWVSGSSRQTWRAASGRSLRCWQERYFWCRWRPSWPRTPPSTTDCGTSCS